MALKLGELIVEIGADIKDLKNARKEVDRTANSMEKSFKRVGSAIAAAFSFLVIKRTILLADNMNLLDSRIRALTKSAKGFREIREGIRGVAKETGGSIASITQLAQRALIAKEALGATNEQIIEMVNNVQKLGVIGGGSQENLTRATVQLGQALSTPRVQAEELNSILEQMPLLAKEIEKNLDLLPGTLKQAVIAGDVLNTDIFQALIKSTDDINRRFNELPLTIDRASGMIANAFAVAVQDLDNGLGVTESIASVMKDLSEVIESDLVSGIDNMIDGLTEFLLLLDGVTGDTQDLADETFDLEQSWKLVKNSISFVLDAIKNIGPNLRDITTIIIGEVDQAFIKLGASISKVWNFIATDFQNTMTSAIGFVKSGFFSFIGGIQSSFAALFNLIGLEGVAETFRTAADSSMQTAFELTTAVNEQVALRIETLEIENEAIDENTEIKLEASQLAIEAGLAETEALKKQVLERIKQLRKERKARRDKAAGINKDSDKEVVTDKKNKDKLNFNLDDAQKTASALESAGILDSKAAAAVQIGISASKAISKSAEVGFPAAIPFIAQALATIATARNALKGGGRQAGGGVSQGVLHPVNENGQPELLIQGSKQFLLSGQSGGRIIPASGMSSGGSGGLNVTVNNNAPDLVEVSEPFVTQGELMIAIDRAASKAIDQVNGSLASGRGETSDSVRQGFNLTRNI